MANRQLAQATTLLRGSEWARSLGAAALPTVAPLTWVNQIQVRISASVLPAIIP